MAVGLFNQGPWKTKPRLGSIVNRANPLNKDSVGFWLFNEGGGTRFNDSVGKNKGILTGVLSWVSGIRGWAFNFNGTTTYITISNDPDLNPGTKSFTITAWIKYNDNLAGHAIIGKGNADTGIQDGYRLSVSYDSYWKYYPYFRIADGTTGKSAYTRTAGGLSWFQPNNWHYVVGVINKGTNTMILYVNGVQRASTDITGLGSIDNQASFPNLYIGTHCYSPPSTPFAGLIDECRIYNRALTASEILKLYTQPHAGFIEQPFYFNIVEAVIGRSFGQIF